jgi:hypothetical protein
MAAELAKENEMGKCGKFVNIIMAFWRFARVAFI